MSKPWKCFLKSSQSEILLHLGISEVKEAHESPAGKKLLDTLKPLKTGPNTSPLDLQVEDGQILGQTVPEKNDLGGTTTPTTANDAVNSKLRRSARARKQTESIYEDPDFRENFDEHSTDISESEESPEDTGSDYGDSGSDEDDDLDTEAEEEFAIGDYVPDNEWVIDEDGGVRLQSRTTKTIRENYSKLSRKEQEAFDQDDIVLRQLLSLDPKKIYVEDDLEIEDFHDRALRLLYRARFGQDNEYTRISPHIRYDKLHKDSIQQINKSIRMSDDNISYLRAMAGGDKPGKGTKRTRPGVAGVKKEGRGKKEKKDNGQETLNEGTKQKRKRQAPKAKGGRKKGKK